MQQALLSSKKMDWQTPDEVLELVRKVGPIGLDPCTTEANPTQARQFITEWDDARALSTEWPLTYPEEVIFINPPYGRQLWWWTHVASNLSGSLPGPGSPRRDLAQTILLVPARPDTRWFQDNVARADEILYWRGRMKFKGAKDPAPFPTLLAYWGPYPARFREAFAGRGVFASELCR